MDRPFQISLGILLMRLCCLGVAPFVAQRVEAQFSDQFGAGPLLIGFTNVVGSNTLATAQPGEPAHAGEPANRSIWVKWTPAVTGTYSISTSNSTTASSQRMDTLLAVYTGTTLSNLSPVASNDDLEPFVVWSEVLFRAHAGETFHIAVDGFGATGVGNIRLQIATGGPQMPPWTAVDLEGRPIVSGNFSNHVLLVDFWETTCVTCVQELPDLVQLYQNYRPRGFNIIGLSSDPDSDLVFEYFEGNPRPPYIIGMASVSSSNSLGGPSGFPTKYLVDQERRIVARYLGAVPTTTTPLQYYSNVVALLMRPAPEIRLGAARDAGGVQLSWPLSGAAFKLEASDAPGSGWGEIPVTIQTNGESITATLPVDRSERFFRLKGP
jgi:thiol-disulfide isomerase/thioredoxin